MRITDHGQATGKLYHLRLRVERTLFCSLQSRVGPHAVLVIGLHELYEHKDEIRQISPLLTHIPLLLQNKHKMPKCLQ